MDVDVQSSAGVERCPVRPQVVRSGFLPGGVLWHEYTLTRYIPASPLQLLGNVSEMLCLFPAAKVEASNCNFICRGECLFTVR